MRLFQLAVISVLMVVITSVAVQAAGLPPGTLLENQASLSYRTEGGTTYSTPSNKVLTTIGQSYGVRLTSADAAIPAAPGGEAVVKLTLANTGNGTDKFVVAASTARGWAATVFADINGDGTLQAEERAAMADSGSLAADEVRTIFAVILIPVDIADGDQEPLTVKAISSGDPTVQALADVTLKAGRAVMTLQKSVDKAEAASGTVITYTLLYANEGSLAAENVLLHESVPLNSTFVEGSLELNGSIIPVIPDSEGVFTLQIGKVLPAASGRITFKVKVK